MKNLNFIIPLVPFCTTDYQSQGKNVHISPLFPLDLCRNPSWAAPVLLPGISGYSPGSLGPCVGFSSWVYQGTPREAWAPVSGTPVGYIRVLPRQPGPLCRVLRPGISGYSPGSLGPCVEYSGRVYQGTPRAAWAPVSGVFYRETGVVRNALRRYGLRLLHGEVPLDYGSAGRLAGETDKEGELYTVATNIRLKLQKIVNRRKIFVLVLESFFIFISSKIS